MRHVRSRLTTLTCAVGAVVVMVGARPAVAQGTGSIRGTIVGPEQKAVFGARVTVESKGRITVTSESGEYSLRSIPAGKYDLEVSALGFKLLKREVEVPAGQTVTLDISLERGSLLLSSVVVSANRVPTVANRVATTINVLTPELVGTSPARESQDLLREIPGVELPRTSSLVGGTAQIVSIRGVDEGRTVVLFDGIPVNDAWGEWIDWGRVPKGMIDRVEVVEGGTSSLYGTGAMGGVISYFSRPTAPGDYHLMLETGSRDARHVFASAGLPIAPSLTAYVSGDYEAGGGYRLIDPLKAGTVDVASEIIQRNAYGRVMYTPSPTLSAFVEGHTYTDDRHTGTILSRQTRDQGNVSMGVDIGAYDAGRLSVRAWDGRQDEKQRSTTIRTGRVAEDSSGSAVIPSHDWGASAIYTKALSGMIRSVGFGGDWRHYGGAYDETAFNTTCPGANCGKVSRTVWSGGVQTLGGVFAQVIAVPAERFQVDASARFDRWSNTDGRSVDATAGTVDYEDRDKTAFTPRLGMQYAATNALSFHAAAYRAFRAPNLAELYRKQVSATQITLPNPDLKPEFATGREIGLDWQPVNWLQFKGTWYEADYEDFNVPVQQSAGPPAVRQRVNVSKSKSRGGEAYVALKPMRPLFIAASVNYDDARVVEGPPGTVVGAHINRVPSPKQNVRATWSSTTAGTWTAIWRHEGKTTTLQGAWLDPYTVIDANVQHSLGQGRTGFLSVENIQDRQYQINVAGTGANAIYSFGMPRTLRVGVTLSRY